MQICGDAEYFMMLSKLKLRVKVWVTSLRCSHCHYREMTQHFPFNCTVQRRREFGFMWCKLTICTWRSSQRHVFACSVARTIDSASLIILKCQHIKQINPEVKVNSKELDLIYNYGNVISSALYLQYSNIEIYFVPQRPKLTSMKRVSSLPYLIISGMNFISFAILVSRRQMQTSTFS